MNTNQRINTSALYRAYLKCDHYFSPKATFAQKVQCMISECGHNQRPYSGGEWSWMHQTITQREPGTVANGTFFNNHSDIPF